MIMLMQESNNVIPSIELKVESYATKALLVKGKSS